jgi:hypothetical protein
MKAMVMLDLEDLKAAKDDMIKRHQIRQKIKARSEHLDKSRYGADVLGLKSAKLLRLVAKARAHGAARFWAVAGREDKFFYWLINQFGKF